MLNWIWLGLIVIAIVVAGGRDIAEFSSDRFNNDKPLTIHGQQIAATGPDKYVISGYITKSEFLRHYHAGETMIVDTLPVTFEVGNVTSTYSSGTLLLPKNAPAIWSDMGNALSDGTKIPGRVAVSADTTGITFAPEPVRFRIFAKLTDSLVKSVETAVTLALGLIGIMALWLGIMKIAEAAGFVTVLAKMARPIMVRLFPEVPPEHPAMGAMLSNMAANFLGLSNAATPLGLKAMEELNKLNPVSGTATNAMCMFLTINTSAITLIPATVIAVRASLGSQDPTDIIIPTVLATTIALTFGVFFNRFIQRFYPVKPPEVKGEPA
jgi:spore maturation protein A